MMPALPCAAVSGPEAQARIVSLAASNCVSRRSNHDQSFQIPSQIPSSRGAYRRCRRPDDDRLFSERIDTGGGAPLHLRHHPLGQCREGEVEGAGERDCRHRLEGQLRGLERHVLQHAELDRRLGFHRLRHRLDEERGPGTHSTRVELLHLLGEIEVALRDNGMTWQNLGDLETERGEYSYPAIAQTTRGVAVSYTWKRERIRCWQIPLASLGGI